MDLLLESPIETLVFRYSAAIAGSIWTFLALLAAALGFWRFRFLGSTSDSIATASVSPSPDPRSSSPAATSAPALDRLCREECEFSPKGRFTAFFLAEDGIDGGDEDEEIGEEREGGSDGVPGGVERFCLMDWRWRGDLGWYRYLDRAAINGSIVRLWDGKRRGSPDVLMRWF